MLRGVRLREELLTKYVIRNSLKYGRSTTLIIPKCERFTLLVRPLQFLVISALRRLGMYKVLIHVFRFRAFCHKRDSGGGGGPQVGEVTRLGGVTRLSI